MDTESTPHFLEVTPEPAIELTPAMALRNRAAEKRAVAERYVKNPYPNPVLAMLAIHHSSTADRLERRADALDGLVQQ